MEDISYMQTSKLKILSFKTIKRETRQKFVVIIENL